MLKNDNELIELIKDMEDKPIQEVIAELRKHVHISEIYSNIEDCNAYRIDDRDRLDAYGWDEEFYSAECKNRDLWDHSNPHYYVADEITVEGYTCYGRNIVLTLYIKENIPEKHYDAFYRKLFDDVFYGDDLPCITTPEYQKFGIEYLLTDVEINVSNGGDNLQSADAFLCGLFSSEEFAKHRPMFR